MLRLFLNFLAIGTICSSTVKEKINQCTHTELQCGDGSCVDMNAVCDGVKNCMDGADETLCSGSVNEDLLMDRVKRSTSCSKTDFVCGDGTCVKDKICDGKADCPDGSDENMPICKIISIMQKTFSGEKCVLPPYPENGSYTVDGVANAKPGDKLERAFLTVACNTGFEVGDRSYVYCLMGHGWLDPMPICSPKPAFCSLPERSNTEYRCITDGEPKSCDFAPNNTTVQPICKTPSSAELPKMHCLNGVWDHIADCKPNIKEIVIRINNLFNISYGINSDVRIRVKPGRVNINVGRPSRIKINSRGNKKLIKTNDARKNLSSDLNSTSFKDHSNYINESDWRNKDAK